MKQAYFCMIIDFSQNILKRREQEFKFFGFITSDSECAIFDDIDVVGFRSLFETYYEAKKNILINKYTSYFTLDVEYTRSLIDGRIVI